MDFLTAADLKQQYKCKEIVAISFKNQRGAMMTSPPTNPHRSLPLLSSMHSVSILSPICSEPTITWLPFPNPP